MKFDTVQMMLPFVVDILEKNSQSKMIAEYLDRLNFDYTNHSQNTYESVRKKFKNLYISESAQRIADCGKSMSFDLYQKQKTKILRQIFLCKNKFCLNCQKQKQLTRLFRFGPILDKTAEDFDLYHITLTNPNCSASELNMNLKKMHTAFTKFINLFLPRKCRKEFKKYGCVACVRSTEITYDKDKRNKGEEYHAHMHVILALKKDLNFVKDKICKYSFDFTNGKKLTRYFSEFEIQLQKIWYLLFNGQKYLKSNIDLVTDGYSVTLDLIDENTYYEVFKYATKIYDEKSQPIEYDQFVTLYKALKGKRTMQGYGQWYNIKNDEEIEEGFMEVQQIIEAYLQKKEQPQRVHNTINEVLRDMTDELKYLYLNMKLIHNIENKDLEKIRKLSSKKQIADLMEKLKSDKVQRTIDKRLENFSKTYLQLRGRLPSEMEVIKFRNVFKSDLRGRITILNEPYKEFIDEYSKNLTDVSDLDLVEIEKIFKNNILYKQKSLF